MVVPLHFFGNTIVIYKGLHYESKKIPSVAYSDQNSVVS
jgi:hypothetical protein